ncbi:hypothetical protein BO71DRAFT_486377 [Aspergillus ellipticus CBS 707.79]|uniref:F-box domain-containing protein n=1 Tax=Aspergillus ellipticus CBS 707.79 TaxID=1448320 RepID=A0A319EK47_9EURO|nr:hypothetical protein BO71DRAFT_486377 [Aspergillus ellipticus CBS 707.79]
MTHPSATTLASPPTELQLHIVEFVEYPARLALIQTNRHFRSIVKVARPTAKAQKFSYLIIAENWSGNEEYFTCSLCAKFLHKTTKFSDQNTEGKFGKQAAAEEPPSLLPRLRPHEGLLLGKAGDPYQQPRPLSLRGVHEDLWIGAVLYIVPLLRRMLEVL